jgi:hypothetical protein
MKKYINRWDEDTIADITTAFESAIKDIESKYSIKVSLGNLNSGNPAYNGHGDGTRLDLTMNELYIKLDPELMGIEFNEKEKKDWKTYQNRSSNKLMKQIRLGFPLVYEGHELEGLLRSKMGGKVFSGVCHARVEGYGSNALGLDLKWNKSRAKDINPYTDVELSVIPCGRHKKMFNTFIPIKAISRIWNKDHTEVLEETTQVSSVEPKVFNDIISQNKLKKLMIQTIKETQA